MACNFPLHTRLLPGISSQLHAYKVPTQCLWWSRLRWNGILWDTVGFQLSAFAPKLWTLPSPTLLSPSVPGRKLTRSIMIGDVT